MVIKWENNVGTYIFSLSIKRKRSNIMRFCPRIFMQCSLWNWGVYCLCLNSRKYTTINILPFEASKYLMLKYEHVPGDLRSNKCGLAKVLLNFLSKQRIVWVFLSMKLQSTLWEQKRSLRLCTAHPNEGVWLWFVVYTH